KAKVAMVRKPPAVMTIANTAPSAAPDEIPTKPGSASGFRKSACMVTPVAARAAPVTVLKSTLGRRISISTRCSRSSSGDKVPHSRRGKLFQGMYTAPLALAASIASARQINRMSRTGWGASLRDSDSMSVRRFFQQAYGVAHPGADSQDEQIVHGDDSPFARRRRCGDGRIGGEFFHAPAGFYGGLADDDHIGCEQGQAFG